MTPKSILQCLAILVALATPIFSAREYLYFSDHDNCGTTYTVGRDDVKQIEAKRDSSSGSSAFSNCELLFRAGNLDDTLCVRINTLSFSNNKLQYQYFKSLDPEMGTTPDRKYDQANPAATPIVFCDNEYEITMKLETLDGTPSINDVTINIEVYNMQGTQRTAYMDTDCGLNYNLSSSSVSVQNKNPSVSGSSQPTCQLYFNYVGTNPNYTVCIIYTKTKDNCGYSLKVYDGNAASSSLANTYTCDNTQPQQWCGTKSSIFLELSVTGSALPEGVFALEVKDAEKGSTFPNGENGDTGLPTWAIAVIIVVAVVVVIAVTAGVCVFVKKSKGMMNRERVNTTPPPHI